MIGFNTTMIGFNKVQSYTIIAFTNGYAMGHSATASNSYVVWKVDDDGNGVSCGHYFNDREEAEWDFCARAFEWFEDNVNIHMIEDEDCEDDQCERCRYNTNDYVCHPHCSGCDGKSHFVEKELLEQTLIGGLKKILAAAAQFIDEMCAIADSLKSERRATNEKITINGVAWSMFFVDKTHAELVDDNGEQAAYGITLPRECEIYIDGELPQDLMRQIITHELLHAFAFSYRESIELETEEKVCDFISAHFDELKACRKAILKSI